MNLGQYRGLVAYLKFWTPQYPQMNLDQAIADLGITLSRAEVIAELSKAGWHFDESTGLLKYEDEEDEGDQLPDPEPAVDDRPF